MQVSPTLSLFGRYGFRNLTTDDQPNIPLPSGGAGNGHIYARNRQFVLGSTWVPTTTSLLEVRFGYSWTEAGKNPPALGTTSAFDEFGLPGLPTDDRIAGGLPTQIITGYSDLGRQATNPQWQYPTVYNPKVNYTWTMSAHSFKSGYEFQRIDTEVQDVNPLYGRDTYNGQFTRPAGAAANNRLQPRRLHARPARAVRAQQRARGGPAPQHALRLPAGRLARDEPADAEPRVCATSTRRRTGRRTTSCRTSIRRPTR